VDLRIRRTHKLFMIENVLDSLKFMRPELGIESGHFPIDKCNFAF